VEGAVVDLEREGLVEVGGLEPVAEDDPAGALASFASQGGIGGIKDAAGTGDEDDGAAEVGRGEGGGCRCGSAGGFQFEVEPDVGVIPGEPGLVDDEMGTGIRLPFIGPEPGPTGKAADDDERDGEDKGQLTAHGVTGAGRARTGNLIPAECRVPGAE